MECLTVGALSSRLADTLAGGVRALSKPGTMSMVRARLQRLREQPKRRESGGQDAAQAALDAVVQAPVNALDKMPDGSAMLVAPRRENQPMFLTEGLLSGVPIQVDGQAALRCVMRTTRTWNYIDSFQGDVETQIGALGRTCWLCT